MWKFFMSYACILIVSRASLNNAQQIYENCRTPDNEFGQCVPLSECPTLYTKISRSASMLTEQEKQYFRSHNCEYDKIDAMQSNVERKVVVCCALPFCKEDTSNNAAEPGNVLPQSGVCGSLLSNRIIGGNVTKIGEFPWMALVEYQKTNGEIGFHCGGTLINSRYVLTAAHCVKTSDVAESWKIHSVRLGEWDTDMDPDCEDKERKKCAAPHVDVGVESTIVHEGYVPDSRNQYYDIALLRMVRNIAYTAFIKPICLPQVPSVRHSVFKHSAVEVAGWGLTENMTPSAIKLKIQINTTDIADCQKTYHSFSDMYALDGSLQLCAGGTIGIDACHGDSGGPLMVKERVCSRDLFFIVGIVSIGPKPCGLPGWPGVYTRVGYYVEWIKSNLKP